MIPRRLCLATLAASAAGLFGTAARANGAPRIEHIRSIGTEGVGEGQFKYVEDFAFTRDGKLLVTDAFHAWVQVFDTTTGAFVTRFGGKGDDDQHLDKPEGIAVDPAGQIFVADYNTGFVKVYGPDFKWRFTFSDYGTEPGQNIKSEFMDIRYDRLYMPEAGNHRVNVFDLTGKFLFLFGGMGTEPGKMNNPEAARFAPNGELFVTDLKNDRVQVFDKDGKYLRHWGSTGSGEGQFRSPAGLAVDAAGRVFVTEIGNDRVQIFDGQGKYLGQWGSKGSAAGQFGNLHGMTIDPRSGLIYVADTANHRVQVFRASFPGSGT